MYRRLAPATGSLGTVTWTVNTKTNLTVLAYSGAADVPTLSVSAAKTGATSTSFTAPAVTVVDPGSAVISFWAVPSLDGDDLDPGRRHDRTRRQHRVRQRYRWARQLPTSSGCGAGPVAARTAVASLSSAKGLGWTVVLKPA